MVVPTSLRYAFAVAVTLLTLDAVCADEAVRPPSFVNDVVPLFTRLGCNQGSCHGKAAGQNGFRLSLRGYAPKWITNISHAKSRAGASVRVRRKTVCCCASRSAWRRMRAASCSTRTAGRIDVLLDWIRAGAPGPNKNDPELKKIDVQPGARTHATRTRRSNCASSASTATARARDVTWLSKFDSNDAGMAEVDANGKVTVRRHGETSIRVSFMTQVAVVVVTSPFDAADRSGPLRQRNNFIDEHVFNKLAALHIEPSDLCTDAEFLRRAYLDTHRHAADARRGARVPCRQARRQAGQADRRLAGAAGVRRLLGAVPGRSAAKSQGARSRRARHEGRARLPRMAARAGAANRPWDELARDVLTASGIDDGQSAVGYYIVTVGEQREAASRPKSSPRWPRRSSARASAARSATIIRWNATRRTITTTSPRSSRACSCDRKEPKIGPTMLSLAGPDGKPSQAPVGVTQPRTGQFLKPQPLDRSGRPSRRTKIRASSWRRGSPIRRTSRFSGAMVNRLWRHFLGVGLVEPVDDLRASNPPTNPELWQALNQEFVGHQFDLKHLMRLILNSRTYQLSAATRPGNETDTRFYSHYYARRLPAEVLLDALCQSTGVPDEFPGYPVGIRAVAAARPDVEIVLPDAVRPVRARDGLRLRAQRRRDDAAAAAPAKRRRRCARFAPATAGWRNCSRRTSRTRRWSRNCSCSRCRAAVGGGEEGSAEGTGRRRQSGRSVPRSLLGAAELEGILVQSLSARNSPSIIERIT